MVDDLRSYFLSSAVFLQMSMRSFNEFFSISAQKYGNCSEFSEISCADMVILAISLLLLMNIPIIWVIPLESIEYSMYSVFAVDPAVSCKKIRPV